MIQYSKSLNPGLGQAQRRGKKKCPLAWAKKMAPRLNMGLNGSNMGERWRHFFCPGQRASFFAAPLRLAYARVQAFRVLYHIVEYYIIILYIYLYISYIIYIF